MQAETTARHFQAPLVDRSKVVQKPKPLVDDVRSFQVGQINRRFKTSPVGTEDGERYNFDLIPGDPDFPYDLDTLQCQLDVPRGYPQHARPALKILNREIPRGFQINIERGFARLAQANPDATLLGLVNRLDRQLESILSDESADTIKIVINKPAAHQHEQLTKPSIPVVARHIQSKPSWTPAEKSDAATSRSQETRQLEARFGRLPAFVKSADGLRFTIPLESPKKSTWPSALQSQRICTLVVPELFPLEPPELIMDGESLEAKNVSQAFSNKALSNDNLALTQLINHLLINMKEMSKQAASPPALASVTPAQPTLTPAITPTATIEVTVAQDPERPHLLHVSRPPEWAFGSGTDESDENSTTDDDSDEIGSHDDETNLHTYATTPIERGVLLSFPQLDMHGIELLELTLLNLTVKCERCKATTDVERIRNTITDGTTSAAQSRTEMCKKCAQPMTVGFRADLMHSSSVRAGYLDLDGCTPADILPSTFTPTCSECSTPHPPITAVRAETAMAICRTCHHKMTLRIQEERFLRMSAIRTSRLPQRKKEKEKLGIVAGTELPRRGKCSHYAKSYRWFRFSCCNKVFPCDQCHDAETDHPNEHANRMICGYCSREQNYRPEDCSICHAVLVGKKGHGFWEGGKGTRDRARMSKKDPRKYQRVGSKKT